MAYDDSFSIEYLYRRLRPYWRRNGMETTDLLERSLREYEDITAPSRRQFDEKLMADLAAGGRREVCTSRRAGLPAGVGRAETGSGPGRDAMFFPKENFSNGCISTVDVIYPGVADFAAVQSELLKASLTPVLEYAGLSRWRFPFAPHDLGNISARERTSLWRRGTDRRRSDAGRRERQYDHHDGRHCQGERQRGNYSAKYWTLLSKWADYLKEKGLDPENQLCTDDFAGHLAHNANLSIKAIVALEHMRRSPDRLEHKEVAAAYRSTAEQFASEWTRWRTTATTTG